MQISKTDTSPNFGERIKMRNVSKNIEKISKDLGCDPEVLVASGAMGSLSSSAISLATGNASGLAKFLPINVSIPLGTGIASTAGYRSAVDNARAANKRQMANAKRKGEEKQLADPDIIKFVFKDFKERLFNLWKINK